MEGLKFPLDVKVIPKFERQNPNIAVNVLHWDEHSSGFTVEYLSPERGREKQVNLLLLEDDMSTKRHYVWISDMSRLVAGRTKSTNKTYVCNSCLHPFSSQRVLDNHVPFCIQHAPQQVIYPNPEDEKDRVLKFRSRNKQHRVPFYLVCDFESFLAPVDEDEEEVGRNTKLIDEHQISGFCCYRVTEHVEHQTPPFVYSGPDPMSKFYDHIMAESRAINYIVTQNVPMLPLKPEQVVDYDNATACGNCGRPFSSGNRKVHHHDHVSGKYLFAACNSCNLQLKPVKCLPRGNKRQHMTPAEEAAKAYEQNFFLPVVFHNLKCYDAHFVIKHFERKHVERRNNDNKVVYDDVKVTPLNSEKYLQFQIGNLQFIDSFQFLSASLDELASLLLKGGKEKFAHSIKHLGTETTWFFSKGVYPYSYMSSRDKFAETQLPPIEAFHDDLKNEPPDCRRQQTYEGGE